MPPALRFIRPCLEIVPKSTLLPTIVDTLDAFYATRGGVDLLIMSRYVDCFRSLHPDTMGYTWPAPLPAGRVDLIFANPELASQLSAASVFVEGEGIGASDASDHSPVLAEFGLALTEHIDNKTEDECYGPGPICMKASRHPS